MRAITERERVWADWLTVLGLALALYLAGHARPRSDRPLVYAFRHR
jgi:hypothetical protein